MADNEQQKSVISDNSFEGKAVVSFPEESVILKEGDVCRDMFKIIQGKAEMYMGYGTDNEVLIGIIGPGTCFGELGLLMSAPAIYTVVAYSDVYAIRVTEERIGDFIKENHASILQIMKDMAHTMSVMQYQIITMSEELNSYTNNEENRVEDMKKEALKEVYQRTSLKGAKLYFLGKKK